MYSCRSAWGNGGWRDHCCIAVANSSINKALLEDQLYVMVNVARPFALPPSTSSKV